VSVVEIVIRIPIAATPARVWQALCDPAEVVVWDTGVTEAIDAPPDYPQPGQRVRWRYRSRLTPILTDEPQEVVPESKLRSKLTLGPYRLDETYLLTETTTGCHLTASIRLSVTIAILGPLIERLYAGPATRAGFETSLASLKRHCEASP
jgi:hypothetical protein